MQWRSNLFELPRTDHGTVRRNAIQIQSVMNAERVAARFAQNIKVFGTSTETIVITHYSLLIIHYLLREQCTIQS